MEAEKRMGEDCEWYTREEFEDFYGDKVAAREEWERSPPRGHEWVAIFHCASTTEQECIDRKLLGGPMGMRKGLDRPDRRIREGTALLLFNFKTHHVHAPYRAAGSPGNNLVKEAWGGRFPWQVRTVGTATRWPVPRHGLVQLLKKNGSWISSHTLPAEWFPRRGAPSSAQPKPLLPSRGVQPSATFTVAVGKNTTPPPADDVATNTGSDVFSDSLSSEAAPATPLAPEVQDELSFLTTLQRQAVRQLTEITGLTTEHALRICKAADFDANRAANFAFAEPSSPSSVAITTAPAPQRGPSYGDTNPFDVVPDDLAIAAPATIAVAATWQQQELVDGQGAQTEAEHHSCNDCGQTGEGGIDREDGHWYCCECWAAMDPAATVEEEPPQIVYMKLSQSAPVCEAERRLLEVLDAFGIRYQEHTMTEDKAGQYVIRDEIEAAKTKAPHVCILSNKSALGRSSSSKMGIICNGEWNEQYAWDKGIQKLIQLSNKKATASPEDCPEVAKKRHYVVRKVIAKLQRMLLHGPDAFTVSKGGIQGREGSGKAGWSHGTRGKGARQTTHSFEAAGNGGGTFAALRGLGDDDEWSDSSDEASSVAAGDSCSASGGADPALGGGSSVCMLAWGRGTPQSLETEARKSAAKLMSTYVFRDLAEDNLSSDEARGNGCAEAWHRAGERHDPMLPCNESAWPNVRIAFSQLLERWWGVERDDPIVQASMEQLLKWCRDACHELEEQASGHHNANLLHPDWQDDESGVELTRGDDGKVWLRHGSLQKEIDSHRLDFMHSLLLEHSPDHAAQANTRVYNCLLRYETLSEFDQGTQGSLPERVFDVLRQEFGVEHECFASPVNVTARSFNSVFPDVDRFFGSRGSFFDFWPDTGSYEANPPFDGGSVAAMFQHINAILTSAEERARQDRGDGVALPLLFITTTPFVPSESLCKPEDRFVLEQITLTAYDHAYTLGMRHRKSGEWRCTNDTVVCFVGNQAAAKAWPITKQKLQLLRQAWAPNA